MKFAQLIAVASAVRLSQRQPEEHKMPTPGDIVEECDASGNAKLDKKEVVDCMMKHMNEVPEEHRMSKAEVEGMVEEDWAMVDKNKDGEVDVHELSKAMRAHGEEMKEGPPALAKIMRRKKAKALAQDDEASEEEEKAPRRRKRSHSKGGSDSEHSESDGEGPSGDEGEGDKPKKGKKGGKGKGKPEKEEELAQKKGGKGKGPKKGPSAEDVVAECDTDASGGVSKDEAHACIDAHMSGSDAEMAHDMVEAGFDMVDQNGDGEADVNEIKAAMKAMDDMSEEDMEAMMEEHGVKPPKRGGSKPAGDAPAALADKKKKKKKAAKAEE